MPLPPSVKVETLVRAIKALDIIEPTGLFERALVYLLMAAYKRHFCGIVEAASAWIREEILSASGQMSRV